MQPTPTHLGATIRRLRTDRQLSVERLAAAAGVHWTYLSGIERGRRNPTWKVLTAIATALDLKLSTLVGETESLAAEEGRADAPR